MTPSETIDLIDTMIDSLTDAKRKILAEQFFDQIVNTDLGPCSSWYNGSACQWLWVDQIERTCECNLYDGNGKPEDCPRVREQLKKEGY